MKVNQQAFRIFLIYVVMGSLWIYFSDKALLFLVKDPKWYSTLQTYKGWFFIIFTGIILYLLINNYVDNLLKQQRQLLIKNKQLETLANTVSDGILVLDSLSQDIQYANKAIQESLGFSESELLGRKLEVLLPLAAQKTRIIDAIWRKNSHATYQELTLLRKDGSELLYKVTVSDINFKDREGILLSLQDISEIRYLADLLQDEKKFIQRFLDTIEEIVLVLDQSFTVSLINKKGCDILGYQDYEILGKHWSTEFLPETAQIDTQRYLETLFRGEKEQNLIHENQVLTKTKDLRDIFWHNSSVRDKHNNIVALYAFGIDITEKKNVEKSLKETALLLQMVVDKGNIGYFEGNLDNHKFYYSENWCQQRGLKISQLSGTFEDFLLNLHQEDIAQAALVVRELCEGKREEFNLEFRCLDGSDNPVWRLSRGKVVKEEFGPRKIIGIQLDNNIQKNSELKLKQAKEDLEYKVAERTISLTLTLEELKKSQQALINLLEDLEKQTQSLNLANEKLKELDRVKSIFIASMSHELRTPLNSIIGFSSIIHEEWLGPLNLEQKENLNLVLKAGKYLLSLINDVIDIARIESGVLEVKIEEVEVSELINEIVRNQELEIERSGLLLKLELTSLNIFTDRKRLSQVLNNLLSNAIKYTEEGFIKIINQVNGDMCEIIIEDSGVGMNAEEISRLFTPFSRLTETVRKKVVGVGLGLYISKKIVEELLQGKLEVQSQKNVGSKFIITFYRDKQ